MSAPASATGSTIPPESEAFPPATPDPSAGTSPYPDRIAQAAASGLMTHADVDEAIVIIDGPSDAPQLLIDCVLADEGEFPRTTELATTVHEQIESLLDVTFDTADVTIRNSP